MKTLLDTPRLDAHPAGSRRAPDVNLQQELRTEIAHGIFGPNSGHDFTNGTAAGMHAGRHVQEVLGPNSLGIRQSAVNGEAEDIMNGVGRGDADGDGVGERREAVDAFNEAMAGKTYRTALAYGAERFQVRATLDDQGVVHVNNVGVD